MTRFIENVIFFVALIVCFVLQTTVANWISVAGASPDFLVILIVYVAFRRGSAVGAIFGFVVGFVNDGYGPVEWLGSQTIAFTLLGYLAGLFEDGFLTLPLAPRLFALGTGFIISDFIFLVLSKQTTEFFHLLAFHTLPECLYTVVVGGVVYFFLFKKKKLKRHV